MRGAPAGAAAAGGQDHGRRAVGERAAHEAGQDAGHLGEAEDLLHGDGLLDLGQGVRGWRCVRALTAAAAICSTVAPRSSMHWRAQLSLRAMRMLPAGLSSARKRGVHVGPVVGRQPVLDPGQGGRPVAGPHLLDPDRPAPVWRPTGRPCWPRCRAEVPPAHELSTLTTGTSPRPDLRSHDWPRMQPWSQQPAAQGVADDDQGELVGLDAGVGEGLVDRLVGHGLGGQVPPAHVRHPRPEDGHLVAPAHAPTSAGSGRRPPVASPGPPGEAPTSSADWSVTASPATTTVT